MALPSNFKPKQGESKYTMTGLQSGETVKIRVLSDFIVGNQVWSGDGENRKPLRKPENESVPLSMVGVDKWGNPERIRQFIAAKVWNYETNQVEIFETTKATIIAEIFKYEQDEDYGDSKQYDLKISKSGQGMDTKYSVIASPPKPLDKTIAQQAQSVAVNLNNLFAGTDPFAAESDENEPVDSEDLANQVPF